MSTDAFEALTRFGRDILVVGKAMPRSYVRSVLGCAALAFTAGSGDRDAAWMQLVLAIDALLRHPLQRTGRRGEAERRRLEAFVDENADVHEKLYSSRAVLQSIA